jgi:NSS family neurotransmitter:Na+ symporter
MSRRRGLWGTRFGFYLAAIGSAFGLGNLWRFPYVTVENGGGAFVLLYVLAALLVGLPLLIGELMLGKIARRSIVKAAERLAYDAEISSAPADRQKRAGIATILILATGRLSAVACLLVFAYYAVISGWVLHFLMQFAIGQLGAGGFDADSALAALRASGLLQVALMSAHLLITIVVVSRGVQEGIEKWVGNVMPVFVALLLILAAKSLSLPSSIDALRFLFYPDFSKLTSSSFIDAIGHVCFTLSLGFGNMVTFGSYLNEDTLIPAAGFRVALVDTLISLFAGLLIFPIAMGRPDGVSGPNVLFLTVPRLLGGMQGGAFFGVAFFLCLYLAALGASIGLFESIVSNAMEVFGARRERAAWSIGAFALALGAFPALSSSTFAGFSFRGRGLLEAVDGLLISGVLPLAALGTALAISSRLKNSLRREEFINDEGMATRSLWSHWLLVMRVVAPLLIAASLGLGLYQVFGK